jgi:hypothetical protein
MDAKKQEYEKWIVEGFLKTTNRQATDIEAHDKPDVLITLQTPEGRRRVGVEVRVHFNDETTGEGSEGQQLNRFWGIVRQEIERLKTKTGQLWEIHAYVELKKKELEKVRLPPLAKKLASGIFGFVQKASETATSSIIVIPDWKERVLSGFDRYPLMEKYVRQVTVRKGFFAFWDANVNATYVGTDPKQMAKIIVEKSEKAKGWNIEGLDELWLLVAAPHDNAFNAMHDFPEQAHLDDPILLAACGGTPFQRIFFWSGPPHEWVRQIWPKTS